MNPEKKFRAGSVSATVWINTNEKGSFPSIQLGRSYLDKEKNWKETSSFGVNDVPKAIVVLNEAYRYVSMREKEKPMPALPA
ncbi:hypothetical protein HYU12_02860 [Candidatus Woesearchaeota archaeon]|nr:hypothetical protein [Candidatus Woesearchaeota archaeon]